MLSIYTMDVDKNTQHENVSVISKDTIRRLIKDIRQLKKTPLDDHGIYYMHDEEHFLTGRALFIGPPDTPYHGGYYYFEFKYPHDYPHRPPKVIYHTNDGHTRMNPNLYRNGKVCLSILNTWQGDQWSGCQTISSTLLSILGSVFTNAPLLNEPGISRSHKDYQKYQDIITYQNYNIAMCNVLKSKTISKCFRCFNDIARDHFLKNYEDIKKRVEIDKIGYANKHNGKGATKKDTVCTSIYNMTVSINYKKLQSNLESLNQSFSHRRREIIKT